MNLHFVKKGKRGGNRNLLVEAPRGKGGVGEKNTSTPTLPQKGGGQMGEGKRSVRHHLLREKEGGIIAACPPWRGTGVRPIPTLMGKRIFVLEKGYVTKTWSALSSQGSGFAV